MLKKKGEKLIIDNKCSLWSEWSTVHVDAVFDGLLVLVLVLLPIEVEGPIFLGGKSLHRLLCPLLLRGMCLVSRV